MERVVLGCVGEMNTDSKNQKALGALGSRGSLRSSPSAAVLASPGFPEPASPFQSSRDRSPALPLVAR
ncbi:hypothetical protein SAMN05216559_0949 [Halomicrobium zhouii]|uniref:Uncharacterized protein n=1 Tax=Halomicrobium zhouii TaxID=767519 RepID=A0A1I6KL79_9EURY|nr:hypothetical protein SAMN05216559_0949 [Halomicrobium zhouii]